MSLRAWVFIWSVLLGGVALFSLSLASIVEFRYLWVVFLLLTVLATAAQLFEVSGPNRHAYYPHLVFFTAGALLLPPGLFALLVTIPHLIEWIKKRLEKSTTLAQWYIQPFNIVTHIFAGFSTQWIYHLFEDGGKVLPGPQRLVLIAIIAATYVGINHLMIGLALYFARGISLRQSDLFSKESLLPDYVLSGLGYIVALLWSLDPWLVIPALCPLLVMYQAFKVPQLQQEAQTDAKTGLLNAGAFNKEFEREFERARRFNRPLAFVMADLDFLRNINNTYGHLAGDVVLSGIGKIIRENVRDYDLTGRFGGEEFAIVLPEAGRTEACVLAERIRAAVASNVFSAPSTGSEMRVTMSLGVACYPIDAMNVTDLVLAADSAVYQAKNSGRNRVISIIDLNAATGPQKEQEDRVIDLPGGTEAVPVLDSGVTLLEFLCEDTALSHTVANCNNQLVGLHRCKLPNHSAFYTIMEKDA
ncbi:MAG TPA: GGDEF domain-containing protein [Chloroflexia bacterium]|nr:GGDEF domain-containing protein [Chloroflexia bacterium]